jgi:hypothetical protein
VISPRPEYYYAMEMHAHTPPYIHIYVAAASASNRLKDSCRQLHSERPFCDLATIFQLSLVSFHFALCQRKWQATDRQTRWARININNLLRRI